MARVTPLSHRPQSIGEHGLSAGTNTANQMKAETLKGFNEAFQEVTDPIVAGALAGEAEADRLAKFELEKNLPIEQIPENEGGFNPFSLTKWGRAYEASYNEIDKQLISYKAEQALKENALLLGRPENQGPGVTAAYAEQSKQIIEAYVANAAPANRTELMLSLGKKAATNEFALAETEAAYNRTQIRSELEQSVKALDDQLFNASIANDRVTILSTARELENNITSQENLNIITHAEARALKDQIASQSKVGLALGQWTHAESEGLGDAFLADIATDPQKHNLTFTETVNFAKTVAETKRVQETLTAGAREVSYFQDAIRNGEASTLSSSEINKQYNNAQSINQKLLESNGGMLTPMERSQSILGIGEVYPVSGERGLSLGTNVTQFDNLVGGMLTSGNHEQMINAAQIYNYHINVAKQPNTLELDRDEVLIASTISSALRSGSDPIAAADLASRTILNKNNPVNEYRASEFDNAAFEKKLPKDFKNVFGEGLAGFETDEAFANFKVLYRQNYIAGPSKEAALETTKYQMKNWGRSDYFPDDKVLPRPPENLDIYNAGFSFNNQIIYRLQSVIDANPNIKWTDKQPSINLDVLTDAEKVLTPLDNSDSDRLPKIKVESAYGDHESEVFLYSGADVDYSSNGNPRYNLVYKDVFGNIQPIMDETGVKPAYFNPAPLSQWAPGIAKDENISALKEISRAIYSSPSKEALKKIIRSAFITGPLNPRFAQESIKQLNKAKERMSERSEEDILEDLQNRVTGGQQ